MQGCPFLDHRPDDLKHLPDFRASINEVAEKNHLPFGMSVGSSLSHVAEKVEQLDEFIGMSLDVADQVVHAHLLFACLESSVPHPLYLLACLSMELGVSTMA